MKLPILPLLLVLLFAGCSSDKKNQDEVKSFLTDWSSALNTEDESVRRFYDVRFVLPSILFEDHEGLKYTVSLDSMKIFLPEDAVTDTIRVTVSFIITGAGVNNPETGSMELILLKTGSGFVIQDMSQELAIKLKEYTTRMRPDYQPSAHIIRFDSILNLVRISASQLGKQYDSVVLFTNDTDIRLFYVINGTWENPYGYENQRDRGDYKIGVVTADNKVIVPVDFDKVYNPNGSFTDMIEVEKDGLRGLFRITGEVFLPAAFDGIYPSDITGVFAQVKQGEKFGWADKAGKVYFDHASHTDKRLFQSPVTNNSILQWEFSYPGPISLLINPYEDAEYGTGILIYPSYVRDFGVTDIAVSSVMLETSEYGMGMTDNVIRFEKSETISDKLSTLVAFFMESGADARGYHTSRNDLLVVDNTMKRVDYLKGLVEDNHGQDPCEGTERTYKRTETGLYESSDGHGQYTYYQVTSEGEVNELETVREFNFTKFVSIDESYFETCRYDNIPYDERNEDGPNLVIISGLSNEDLDIMRNEIFAEYGFIFKSEKWKTYFGSKPWYKSEHQNVDNLMTEQDKKNVKFILQYQQQHKELKSQLDSVQYGWAG